MVPEHFAEGWFSSILPRDGSRAFCRGMVLEHFAEGAQAKRMEKMVLGCHPFRAWISRGHLILKITPFQGWGLAGKMVHHRHNLSSNPQFNFKDALIPTPRHH